MRRAKLLGWIIGGCVVLLSVSLLAVRLLVDPNHYKPQIAAAVEHATGRELRLTGNIHLSVLPWIALELGPASLGNPPGFGAEPFVSFSHAAIRVRLLPLLRKHLEISRIEIDGLDLRLQKNADGKGNWQDVGPTVSQQERPTAEEHPSAAGFLGSRAEVKIRHGRISYQNLVVADLVVETGSLAGHRDVPVNITFDAQRGVANEQITVMAKFDLSEEPDQFRFAAVNLSGTVSRPGDGRPVHWDIAAPTLAVDLEKQTLAMPSFAISYSSARVTGSVVATRLLDVPNFTGSIDIGPLVLHEFVPRLGIFLPKTRDAKVLADLSGHTEFTFDSSGLSLDKMQLRLDDTQLNGRLKFSAQDIGALEFDLRVDKIDLNRYLSPVGAEHRDSAEGSTPVHAANAPPALDGTLRIASLRLSSLDLSDLSVTIASDHGVIRLYPIQAAIDGGRYSGNISYDAHAAEPSLSVDEHLASVDMLRLLANTPQRGRISGQADVNLKGSAQGATADALLKSLDGQFDAHLTHGAIEGIDVGYEVGLAQSLLERRAAGSRQDTQRTRFDAFGLSAHITNGVAQTHDVTISSDVLKVTGQGTANLPTKAIDFDLSASILKSSTDTGVDIPLRITGTYTDPTIRPDVEAVAKGQLKQKLQEVLKKNGLQGLFGR